MSRLGRVASPTVAHEQYTCAWDETDPFADSPQPYDHRPAGWGEKCRLVSMNIIVFDAFGEKRIRYFWTWEREV